MHDGGEKMRMTMEISWNPDSIERWCHIKKENQSSAPLHSDSGSCHLSSKAWQKTRAIPSSNLQREDVQDLKIPSELLRRCSLI